MMLRTKTVKVYQGAPGCRWRRTVRAACNDAAFAVARGRCDCEPAEFDEQGYMTAPGIPCALHSRDGVQYERMLVAIRRLADVYYRAAIRERRGR